MRHLTRALALITCAMVMACTPITDCNDPDTWATASGVRHCAVNEGR